MRPAALGTQHHTSWGTPLALRARLRVQIERIRLRSQPAVHEAASPGADAPTWIRGPIKKGTVVTSDQSLMVIGNVHPGAELRAAGDITVWGQLAGAAHAGTGGSTKAQIMALEMRAAQLRIADVGTFANAKVSVSCPHVVSVLGNSVVTQLGLAPANPGMPAPSEATVAANFSRWTTFHPAAAAALMTGIYAITLGAVLLLCPGPVFGCFFKASVPDGWVQVGGALLATFGLQYLLSATGDYARARTNRRAVLAQGRGQAPPADAPEAPAPAAAPMTAAPAAAAASQEAPGPGTTAQSGGSVAASSRQGRTAILPQPVEQVADDAGKQIATRFLPPGERQGVVEAPAATSAGTRRTAAAAAASAAASAAAAAEAAEAAAAGGEGAAAAGAGQRAGQAGTWRRGRAPTLRAALATAQYMHSTSFYSATVWARLFLVAVFTLLVVCGLVERSLLLLAALNFMGACTMLVALKKEQQLHQTMQEPLFRAA